MPWKDIVWNHEEGGNVDHIADNGLSIGDVEKVVMNPKKYGKVDLRDVPFCLVTRKPANTFA